MSDNFGPSPIEGLKVLIAVHQAMTAYISRVFGIPPEYFQDIKELHMEPKDKDEHEVVQVYDDPKADTKVWYDEDDRQHVEVKDDKNSA